MKKTNTKKSQAGHSWGILLSMAAVPILALLSKISPNLNSVWAVLLIICGLLFVRSLVGYFFPAAFSGSKKPQDRPAVAHSN